MDSPFPPDGASHPAADRTLRLPMRLLGRTIARTREALAGLEPGAVLCVRTDDPWAVKDLPAWARWNGQQVLAIERLEDGWHAFYLRKGRAGRSLLRPALALPALPLPALRFALARALSLAGKPWRRTAALLRARSG